MPIFQAKGGAVSLKQIVNQVDVPDFEGATLRFLYSQLYPGALMPTDKELLHFFKYEDPRIRVFYSAVAHYYSPSDPCGGGGMIHARIRSNPNWMGRYPRYDTVLVAAEDGKPGMSGMTVARVKLFCEVVYKGEKYPCALVEWFARSTAEPDDNTGYWVVEPELNLETLERNVDVVHLDCIARPIHVLPVFGSEPLPEDFHFSNLLDAFAAFYVNKFANHGLYDFVQ